VSYVYRAYCSVPSSKHDDSNTLIMSDATPASEYVISVRGPNTKPYAYELNIDLHREQITGCKRLAGWERVYYRIRVPFCKATAGTDMWFMWSLQWCRSPAYQFVDQLDCLTVPGTCCFNVHWSEYVCSGELTVPFFLSMAVCLAAAQARSYTGTRVGAVATQIDALPPSQCPTCTFFYTLIFHHQCH